MKKNVLDVKVSLFTNVQSNKPLGEISLYDFLCNEKYQQEYQPLVEKYRTADYKDELKRLIPAVTVSGTFKIRNTASIKAHSGLICIDIDAKDNEHLPNYNELHKAIANVPNVAYCGRSVSGAAYFAIIPISDSQRHREHFEALKTDFRECEIIIDNSCGDIPRFRIYSYDPNAYININAQVYDRTISISQTSAKLVTKNGNADHVTATKAAKFITEIVKTQTDITKEYKHWIEIASVFYNEFGEAGRALFHMVSCVNKQYSGIEANKQFDDIIGKPYPYSIGTFFKHAKDAGLRIV